jgi:peptidyl-Lys metalloendopeptidase
MHVSTRLAFGLVAALAAGVAQAAPNDFGLFTSIDPAADAKSAAGTGTVRFSIGNRSARAVHVLSYQTPLGGIEDDVFEVTLNGKPVQYIGRHYKRPLPQAGDYVELAPGTLHSVEVDLTAYYEMKSAGAYRIAYHGALSEVVVGDFDAQSKARAAEGLVHSAEVTVFVDGAHVTEAPDVEEKLFAKAGSVSFVGCSNTQANSITSAVSGARSYSENAKGYLNAGTVGPRYTTWFGTYSSNNYNTVKSHFAKIDDAMDNKPLAFYCDCSNSAYAYVYPSDPYKVHLCNAFWSAPTTGTDSKAGTIIHEVSHFNVVAGTNDNAYGQTACKRLAQQNPKRAIGNADSHEYFAENKPAQN